MPNRNILWGQIFIDELARSGLKAVCAAPGSRHTPLMLAFAKHPDIKVYSHLDERSAAFFALGLALASDAPVALVCSSGTAGANMYPAIIEAHQSRVPLIVLTADRPHELRHSGANQTIDQIKMFGEYALWFVDMQLPEANPPAIAIRNLRTTANRAYAKANGLRKGVVHLNFPFRKPLEPTPVEGDIIEVPEGAEARLDGKPFTRISHSTSEAWKRHVDDIARIRETIRRRASGVIVVGGHIPDDINLNRLSINLSYPVIAESYSNQRHGKYRTLGTYDYFLNKAIKPNIILRIGDAPISNTLNKFIAESEASSIVCISENETWSDDLHIATEYFVGNVSAVVRVLEHTLGKVRRPPFSHLWTQYERFEEISWQVIDHEIENGAYFDGAVVYDVVDLIPDESTLFAGNSLAVRHLDQFGKPQQKHIYTYANRGASGIDGNISTALGTGAARPDKPLVAIVGDITFYHDMNGLLAVHRCGVPITIVLINNDGGGIFNRLPISNFEPEFTDYFITPHGLDFSHAAKLYGLDYVNIDIREGQSGTREAFRKTFSEVVGSKNSTIIEVRTDGKFDNMRRQEIVAVVHAKLEELQL